MCKLLLLPHPGIPFLISSGVLLVTWKTVVICWLSVPLQLSVSCLEAGRGLFSSGAQAWHTVGAQLVLAAGMTV